MSICPTPKNIIISDTNISSVQTYKMFDNQEFIKTVRRNPPNNQELKNKYFGFSSKKATQKIKKLPEIPYQKQK